MALSDKTQEYLNEAGSMLRNALYWAAKNERPHTIQGIAELLTAVDKISTMDDVLDSLDTMKTKWKNKNGGPKDNDHLWDD